MIYEESETMITKTNDDGIVLWIPKDFGNKDYIEYLEWKAAQK